MALASYTQAKAHLRLPDDESKKDVIRLTEVATAVVLDRIGRAATDSPVWDEDTDPAEDGEFSRAQAAVLMVLGELWRDRGDEEEKPFDPNAQGYLSPRVERLLYRMKDPSLA